MYTTHCLLEGARSETSARLKGNEGYETEGVRGLKALGVRDLTYKMAFLACTVTPSNRRVRPLIEAEAENFYSH